MYLTARSQERGEAALKDLLKDDQLLNAKALNQDGGLTEIKYHSLDISESSSIQDFASYLKQEHPDGIDILINNAAIAMDGFSEAIELLLGHRDTNEGYRFQRGPDYFT